MSLVDELVDQAETNEASCHASVLAYCDGSSNKFWVGFAVSNFAVTWWGRRGTTGQSKLKVFPNPGSAAVYISDKCYEKLGKGYTSQWEGETTVDLTPAQLFADYVAQSDAGRQLMDAAGLHKNLVTAAGFDPTA